jgi:hypothetical protein
VVAKNRFDKVRRAGVPVGSPIKHVIYVIKENRTYDQVLGDLPQGDGDTSLVYFGRAVTPNHHALAERFGLFDNFRVNAEVSGQGHNWSTAAYASDYLEINMIRNASILGVAREVAAVTGKPLRQPVTELNAKGPAIEGKAFIEIRDPELNPRFVAGLIQGVTIGESPYWVQRRLRLAGMRPISNIVDATNYVMLEIGEPLHAFDYDRLV